MKFRNAKILFLVLTLNCILISSFDLTIVGHICFEDGIHRLPISFVDMLKDDLKINFISSRPNLKINFDNIPFDIKKFLSFEKAVGEISILVDWISDFYENHSIFVPLSKIKFAYSMFETTKIPNDWVSILNNNFDAVIVPDNFLVSVYKNSNVNIPIFVLPIPLILDKFLLNDFKTDSSKIFTFGVSSSLIPRKNIQTLIDAFNFQFSSSLDVKLKIHYRNYEIGEFVAIKNKINELNVENIELIDAQFNEMEYIHFMKSLDCYVFISKGEGFSITPREAMASGVPCIISDNTVHKTIAESGFVEVVPSYIQETAYYQIFKEQCGCNFNCKLEDVSNALRKVYENYGAYKNKVNLAREWVKQYLPKNLKNKYLSLFKPKKIFLGNQNLILEDFIMTDSKSLYEKYIDLFSFRK